ncbi:nucleotide exchange factor GrpE [Deinococcus sp.]|uniref:nucleotide exchange factor GrpE n=1 Tax=Deinococcus sp. TaxID=47478 RepID=UPI0025C02343|nr:nucleotide exchange factor GrpE [Deinococcus sp.]
MSDDTKKTDGKTIENDTTENIKFGADETELRAGDETDADFAMPEGFPDMDENMMGQVQDMMTKLQRYDELEAENADLKGKLGRLAADFEGYRNRTAAESAEAQSRGVSKAAEALMPVYDDMERAVSLGVDDPAKLIPGMQAVQNKILTIFGTLGLETTGREGETFDPQWHEAIQVVEGEEDDKIVQTYQLGFKMGDRLVRPARVVVSKKG